MQEYEFAFIKLTVKTSFLNPMPSLKMNEFSKLHSLRVVRIKFFWYLFLRNVIPSIILECWIHYDRLNEFDYKH